MQITLNIKGEEKTFIQNFVPAKFYRLALSLLKKIDSGELEEEDALTQQYELIVGIFDKQFTLDQLEEGLDARKVDETIWDLIRYEILGWKKHKETKAAMDADFLQRQQLAESNK